jgi:hypothetical protein
MKFMPRREECGHRPGFNLPSLLQGIAIIEGQRKIEIMLYI